MIVRCFNIHPELLISHAFTRIHSAFDVFVSTQGKQGHLGRASNQQLETVFGSKKGMDVAEVLLKGGALQAADSLHSDKIIKNLSHGGYQMDLRGSGAQTTGA